MNIKKIISASAVFALALVVGGSAVAPAFAASDNQGGSNGGQGWGMRAAGVRGGARMMGQGGAGVVGTVSSVTGDTLTVLGRQGFGRMTAQTASTTFTVDATNAVVMKDKATSTVSSIAVGDMVFVQGTVSGANVTATMIRDGVMPGRPTVGMMNGKNGGEKGGELKKLNRVASTSPIQGNGQPVVAGKISTINGATLTLTNQSNVTYTVDATNAKVVLGRTVGALSDVSVGDAVVVQGTVNGTSIVASSVVDQKKPASTTGNPQSHTGGVSGFFGGIGSFFKHLFGF